MERPWTLLLGDSREALRGFADSWVDSIVTDPPYELGFMGRSWDASGVAYDVGLWREALRVLKPGGHLLAFGGTRTYHRMACAIEDAGFEVRDSLHWIYGSGFPKSLDVSKAIDKQRYDQADIYRVTAWVRAARDAARISNRDIDEALGFAGMAGHWTSAKSQPAVPTLEQVPLLLGVLGLTINDVPDDIRLLLLDLNGRKGQPGENWMRRQVTGQHNSASPGQTWSANYGINANLTPKERRDIPATDAARQWAGWGTALKPAHEPIVVARKPLDGTVAANVLAHGTGAINVDGCRVAHGEDVDLSKMNRQQAEGTGRSIGKGFVGSNIGKEIPMYKPGGRWPPNILLSHAPDCGDECAEGCAVAEMDGQSEGASRFFPVFRYQAKASRKDRGEGNTHPTVKPIELMRWLVRLVTPPGGVVLDPFTGSGTTGIAARREGATFVGIEREPEYHRIALARIAAG